MRKAIQILDDVLNKIQLYSYKLFPNNIRIGNSIMDFREKFTISK